MKVVTTLDDRESVNEQKMDLRRIKPYGDALGDGKMQLSFTLPLEYGSRAEEAARKLAKKMGLQNPQVVYQKRLSGSFTFFILYGDCSHVIDATSIAVPELVHRRMDMNEIDDLIRKHVSRKIIVIGATTGTDAHTVGLDAILNMKGFSGHYGIERYEMFEVYNMGSQVPNEEFIATALEEDADALLVSQTVTARDVHVKNLTELIEIVEAEGIRDKLIMIAGGPRITGELAKELGFDAGFGPGTFAEDVASFIAHRLIEQKDRSR